MAGVVGAGQPSASAGSGGSNDTVGGGGSMRIDVTDAGPDGDTDTKLAPDAACGVGTAEASLEAVNMFIMFDRSGSMVDPNTIDPTTMLNRWQTATQALESFVRDPAADGYGVALRFFPDDRPAAGCTDPGCDATACSEPLVDFGRLTAAAAPADAQEQALLDAIDAATPVQHMQGGTPISAALQGAATWATTFQAQHADERTVILFITDGEPRGCDERFWFLVGYASDALAKSGVRTYSIGLTDTSGAGVNKDDMDSLAMAGGTDHAFFISDGPTAASDLLQALNSIRGNALGCDFPMPTATSEGKPIDPGLVNVTYTAADGSDTEFTKVLDPADCETSSSWYYDDEKAPTRVELCPAACALVSSDSKARFQILVGCAPILKPPR
jgi:hypothetical protein